MLMPAFVGLVRRLQRFRDKADGRADRGSRWRFAQVLLHGDRAGLCDTFFYVHILYDWRRRR